jgi:Tfp pilus assembly protein PilO
MRGTILLRERRWLVLAAVAAMFATWIVFAEIVPRARAVAASGVELSRSHDAAVDPEGIASQLKELRERRTALEAALAALSETRGCGSCTAEVFGRVRELIDESGVTLLEFRPAAHTLNETTLVTPVEITASGRFHDLGLFIDGLEGMQDVVVVRRLDAKAADAGGQLDIRLVREIVSIREV